jgi:hypothetical protein
MIKHRQVLLITFIIFFLAYCAEAQSQLKKLKEWKEKSIESITVDRLGDFFLILKKGGIKKIDPNGKLMARLKRVKPTEIEPWYHPSIFIYQREEQKYFTYGRFFENKQTHLVPPQFAIEPYLVCPTHDNMLWIFDKADYSMKKINPLSEQILIEFLIENTSSKPDFEFLKDYQNLIFLKEKSGELWIVNTMGKVINKILISQSNFNFFGQELYYLDGNTIRFLNLLTEEKYELTLDSNPKFAIVTDERILIVLPENKVILYDFKP